VSGTSIAVIALAGELEIGRREELREALHLAGTEPGILLECSEVTYADSTALAELLRFRNEADALGIPLAIVIASRQFARLIQYAGLADAFAIFDTRGPALTYLASVRSA
jgi:anti-anti-sigma factor